MSSKCKNSKVSAVKLLKAYLFQVKKWPRVMIFLKGIKSNLLLTVQEIIVKIGFKVKV